MLDVVHQEPLYTVLDVVHPEPHSWACSLQVPDRLHCLRSLATTSFHHRFCPPAEHLPPTGAHTRSCLDSRSFGILERCSRKQRRRCKRIDDIFGCFAILRMVVWCFFSLTETPRMILTQRMTKDSRWRTWGYRRTVLSKPYSKVGRMTLFRM